MQAGSYTLHLYCDKKPWHEHALGYAMPNPMGEYGGEIGSSCRARARKAGWMLHRDGRATCPECNPRKGKQQEERDER